MLKRFELQQPALRMKISTLCVCRNAASTIRVTVESFLEQDHPHRELVVVDGLSTDKTVAVVKSYASPLITVHSGKDKGIYDAMNKALTLYTGDAAGFLNADDCYHSRDALSVIADNLSKAPIVTGGINLVPDHGSGKIDRVWQPKPFTRGSFARGWAPPHPATYALRRVFDAVGGFDTRYKIAADYDWLLRALEIHKFDVVVLNRVLADMQLGGLSTSGFKASWANLMETRAVRRQWLNAGVIDAATVARVFKRVRRLVKA